MTHDPLCPDASATGGGCEPECESCDDCQCDLIAKVRADERGKDDKEDDRKPERDRMARRIVDSEPFMWLMLGSNHTEIQMKRLREAYAAYSELDGGYGRWRHRQRNKPWQNHNENVMELTEDS